MPEYRLPPSQLVSEEFRKDYVDYLAAVQNWPPPPAMNAPKSEWDKFDADSDRLVFQPPVDYDKKAYPVDIVDTRIAGVHVGIVTPKAGVKPANAKRVLINVHGGAFFMGRGLMAGLGESIPLASIAGMKVITVDYRMAPYHRYPAASEDLEAVYRELLKDHKPEQIGLYGCSAGGYLTAQAVVWLRSKNLPPPGAIGIFCASPMTGKGQRGDSSGWSATGLLWNAAFMQAVGKVSTPGGGMAYLETADPADPRAYPGASDTELAHFPPTLFVTGTRAAEMSAAIVANSKLLKLGVDSQLYLMEGAPHGAFVNCCYRTAEARDTWTYIAQWFDRKLQK
jgi:acetyl esterase/lipase